METMILASANKKKIEEFKQIFADRQILSLADIGFNTDIEETGTTFLENALIKAKTISEYLKQKGTPMTVIADDSGLCVNALNGEPGLYSARYSGVHGNDADNRKKLIEKLDNKSDRTAYFICVIAEYLPDGTYIYGEGRTQGEILKEETGDKSFGYDCLFYSYDLKKCFGNATHDEKNSVSHRGRAIADLKQKENLNKKHN